jgi:hypothetical protein
MILYIFVGNVTTLWALRLHSVRILCTVSVELYKRHTYVYVRQWITQNGKDSIFEVPYTPAEYIFSLLRVYEVLKGVKK